MPKALTCEMFGGEGSEAQNALMSALQLAADHFDSNIYDYLDKTPKTSLVVELIQALKEFGYEIKKV